MFAARTLILTGAGFNPLSLSPALWLDAADSSTLFDATSGGSLPADGAAVARWEDKSGNARHATQATVANRPTRAASAQNGRDVLAFDGSNDFLATVAFGGNQTWTRFVVFVSLANQYKVVLAHGSAFNTPSPGADYLATNALKLEGSQNGGTTTALQTVKTASGNNTPTNTYLIASQQTDGTNAGHEMRVNGATFSVTNSLSSNPGNFTKASTAMGIGAYNAGGSPCQCRIAEVLHFPAALATSQRQQVERYLSAKWGIALA